MRERDGKRKEGDREGDGWEVSKYRNKERKVKVNEGDVKSY